MTAITVLFGTETGNSELLAEEITDDAKARGFQAVCHGMDEISIEDFQAAETLLIVCSTWGDGEQPDNAQDLYDTVSELEDAALSGLSFSVLALGDTSFDLFCEAGIQWDNLLESKGATRIAERMDCDVMYEDEAAEWSEGVFDLLGSSQVQ
ncbi:MAG: hypothetical protein CMB38_02910 [Euryarchaeota archaeon]|nr:hypothetical protein [Euryarchaeota archaeon]|tara:strand:- start:3849 stop:4304 length:456 start_codon:yes stop_codon:yes gene_type:complete